MGTYRQILYHIVFGTKYREPVIIKKNESELYRYIWGILKNKKCKLYRINGMPDHVHILCDLHPGVSLSSLIKDIKIATNVWIKESGLFPEFTNWQEGYGAFTCSVREKETIINYIKNQKEHHRKESFEQEFSKLLKENGIECE
ncbi:IS200/IS605 family transposase [Chryseobacterium sp. JJR-5R]|uniref:IS200/IS605 family transposase n=1 Tax=Chryseobacterium sp. JJR-5R TaxID=3093923 RepID=UPI002A748025|nr:IS200/IS605 family transposase [Chryseobacterium sp. JJR-5R]WPO81442.1 IS200/IS605 family transposase [Chryseobacterium sp. JJR-5R]